MDFAKLLSLFLVYKYPIIFLVTIVEGPIIMIMSGFLLRLDLANFWFLYATLMAGDLVGDAFWYGVGYNFAHPLSEKYGKYVGLTSDLIAKIKNIFKNHEKKILFISKITMGFGFNMAVLIVAGMSKISFKKYLSINFLGQFIWTAFLLSIGYFFGNIYQKINKDLRYLSIFVFVVVIFLIFRGVSSYIRNRKVIDKID